MHEYNMITILQVLYEVLDSICFGHAVDYNTYKSIWTLQHWWDVIDAYKNFVVEAVRTGVANDEVYYYSIEKGSSS